MTDLLFWFAMLSTTVFIASSCWYYWLIGGDSYYQTEDMALFTAMVSGIFTFVLLLCHALAAYLS